MAYGSCNIDCHADFFTLLELSRNGAGEPAVDDYGSLPCNMNIDSPAATTTTTTKLLQLHSQSDDEGRHYNLYNRQPQATGSATAEDKENNGLSTNTGFLHANGICQNKVGFLDYRRGSKRLCESGECYNFQNDQDTPSKRLRLEENGYVSHMVYTDGDLPDDSVPPPAVPGNCAEMTSELATTGNGSQAPTKMTSICSQCGKKKHKKFCTGYMEEMMYCSQMSSDSASLMPCVQCLSGQSGHLEHIAAHMDMS